jgi:predicted nucleic acid-binding protein
MTLVVADTGPINYLVQIGCVGVLPRVVEKVVIPSSVRVELLHEAAPDAVRAWAASAPSWVEFRAATLLIEARDISYADREAISLAQELRAPLLLMDDQKARQCASASGVATIGTVGLLEKAAARDLVVLSEALRKLQATSFFITDEIVENALKRDAERRRRGQV